MVRTVTVPAARLSGWLDGFAERHGAWEVDAGAELVHLTGADGAQAWIHVPFAPLADPTIRGLITHVKQERQVGVLLVRRGGYAAGVFAGRRLVASKVGSSYVQGTTKAGGWSQQRYARRRANQASAAFAEAADAAVRVFDDQTFEALVLGGDREAVRSVLADPRLAHLEALVRSPWLAVKDPKLKILQSMPDQFLALRIDLDP